MTTRGGKREGAGRKPGPFGKKVRKWVPIGLVAKFEKWLKTELAKKESGKDEQEAQM